MVDSTKRKVDSVRQRKNISKGFHPDYQPAELTESMKKRRAKKTTSDDVPGSGGAKRAARALEKRKRRLRDI